MNGDYLINKEGNDFEVEQLESLLSEFRIDPVPPSMSRIGYQEQRSTFRRFKMSFALGLVSICVVLLAAGYLFMNVSINRDARERATLSLTPAPVLDNTADAELPDIRKDVVEQSKSQFRHEHHVRKLASSRIKRSRPVGRETAGSRQKLTPEERYAYQQVKLALFIASTKIKIVQNTIDRVDEVNNRSSKSNR